MRGRIVPISVSPGGVPKTTARVLATGSIRAGDRVRLVTDAEAARMLVPART